MISVLFPDEGILRSLVPSMSQGALGPFGGFKGPRRVHKQHYTRLDV